MPPLGPQDSSVDSVSFIRRIGALLSACKGRLAHYLGDARCYQLYERVQQLLGYPSVYRAFRRATGHELSLVKPVTFADKTVYLKLFDKDPILPTITDKVSVRPWVAQRIGEQYLIPLLGVYDSPEQIKLDSLPRQFIIKVNIDTGRNIVVTDKRDLDWKGTKARLMHWLKTPQAYHLMEWNHHVIRPRILIEQLLLDEQGRIPADLKFHVFHGEVGYIHRRDVGTGTRYDSHHTPQWEHIPMRGAYPEGPEPPPKPGNLPEMIQIARTLSSGFIYTRVDLYSIGGRIYFGEMTPHTASGHFIISPDEYNKMFGDQIDVSTVRPSWTGLRLR